VSHDADSFALPFVVALLALGYLISVACEESPARQGRVEHAREHRGVAAASPEASKKAGIPAGAPRPSQQRQGGPCVDFAPVNLPRPARLAPVANGAPVAARFVHAEHGQRSRLVLGGVGAGDVRGYVGELYCAQRVAGLAEVCHEHQDEGDDRHARAL
jgi:hypothetical protein